MYRRWRDVMFASPRRISPSSSDLTAHATVLLRPRRTPRWSSWYTVKQREPQTGLGLQISHCIARSQPAQRHARLFRVEDTLQRISTIEIVDHVIFDIAHRQHCASEAGPGARIRVTMIVKVRLESKSSCARSWVYARRPCGRRARASTAVRGCPQPQRAPAIGLAAQARTHLVQ